MKRTKTTSFLLELPLRVDAGQAHRLPAHLEVARCFYNAVLGEANQRLHRMRADPAWQAARALKSKSRGMDSVEGKRNDTGMRFLLQRPEEGNAGWLLWGEDRIPALIEWNDPVVQHGLRQRIKYVRLIRRKASSPQARGTDSEGNRYGVQLILEGIPYQKPKNQAGTDTIGLDIGPSSVAIFPHQGKVQLKTFCEELKLDSRKKRRLDSVGPTIRRTTTKKAG